MPQMHEYKFTPPSDISPEVAAILEALTRFVFDLAERRYEPPRLLTSGQAAAQLGISQRQLRELTYGGAIAYVDVGLNPLRPAMRYERAAIDRFIAERMRIRASLHERVEGHVQKRRTKEKVFDVEQILADLKAKKAAKREAEKQAKAKQVARMATSRRKRPSV